MNDLKASTLEQFVTDLGEARPTPGGGAAAAVTGALAAALSGMIAGMTSGRRRYEAHWELAGEVARRAAELSAALLEKGAEDAVVYQQVMTLLQHQSAGNQETALRALEDALIGAAQVPLEVARLSVEAARLARQMVEHGNVHAAADGFMACSLAQAAVRGSVYNVRVNLREVGDEKLKRRWENEGSRLLAEADQILEDVRALADARLFGEEARRISRSGRGRRRKDHGA